MTLKRTMCALLAATMLLPTAIMAETSAAAAEVDVAEFNKVWRSITKTTLITLDVEGKASDAFISDVDYDIMTDSVVHADFFAVSNTKKVVRSYKIQYSGTPAGVLKGGFMVKHIPSVQLKALPDDMPTSITADVSGVEIGQKFTVADLHLSDKITLITKPTALIVTIAPPKK